MLPRSLLYLTTGFFPGLYRNIASMLALICIILRNERGNFKKLLTGLKTSDVILFVSMLFSYQLVQWEMAVNKDGNTTDYFLQDSARFSGFFKGDPKNGRSLLCNPFWLSLSLIHIRKVNSCGFCL